MNYLLDPLKSYADPSGRATRKQYWMFALFQWIIILILLIIGYIFKIPNNIIKYIVDVYVLVTFLPSICLSIRRLHDTGRSGSYLFWSIIPLVGSTMILVITCQESGPDNEFGPNPYNAVAPEMPTPAPVDVPPAV